VSGPQGAGPDDAGPDDDARVWAGSELDRRFAGAKSVADTVCYEGYVLYPYRASSQKNQLRWQFGVLAPPSVAAGGSEPSGAQAEIIVETRPGTRLQVRLRALQVQQRVVQQRVVQVGGDEDFVSVASLEDGEKVWTSFDEAVEHQADLVGIDLDAIGLDASDRDASDRDASDRDPSAGDASAGDASAERGCSLAVKFTESRHEEPIVAPDGALLGRVVRQCWPVSARLEVMASALDGPYPLTRVTLRVDNDTDWADPQASRDQAMRCSLIAAHLLVAVDDGRFISSLEPPRFASEAVASCTNTGLFPVLVGHGDAEDVVLASPIILYDYPVIAPESEGDMFDAAEIDEILALRVLTLTEDEKRQARSTDPRSAAIIDRIDAMGVDSFDALHGTFRSIRSLRPEGLGGPPGLGGPGGPPGGLGDDEAPWWEPQVDASFDPWTDTIDIDGVTVGAGTHVRLHPQRRSDAQDLFVDGRSATVAGVFNDVSGDVYLAVALDVDDPDAELHQWHGRYLYFNPDEVELLSPPSQAQGHQADTSGSTEDNPIPKEASP